MIRKLIQWLFFFIAIAAAVAAFLTIQEKMGKGMTMGPPNSGMAKGQAKPPSSSEMPKGQFTPPDGSEMPKGQFTPPDGAQMPNGQFTPPSDSEISNGESRSQQKEGMGEEREMPTQETKTKHTSVNVISVNDDVYQASIKAYGGAQAHYKLDLTSQVSGLVIKLAKNFESGQRISKKSTLVELEGNSYQAAIATAKANNSSAQLEYLQEVRQGEQAKAEWKTSGLRGQPKSPLVLRKPQLVAARAKLDNTKTALANAKNNLRKTQIKAPFNAMIMERNISPGSYVQAGSIVATLYSTDWLEIPLALSSSDWDNLPDEATLIDTKWPITLKDVESERNWTGTVLRIGKQLDTTTRQRTLIVKVDNPFDQEPALLPGTFVEAQIKGRKMEKLWKLPASSLSQRGMIWYVSEDITLNSFPTKIIFSDNDSIYIKAPDDLMLEVQQVLTHPLNAYVIGLEVDPVENDNTKVTE